ncbi:FAD:protein FMN transferase [Thalassotalea sp. Y01]|uniref:FAD:protein FMN transferase n=1 Tax=Thalassotalea sp. Y01 TaxID=2729613 RepID=UPI00145D2944|nr:FAD:protein FMN transferase [Thalassotalea sp. Y01]NMP15612.1 FAD:protein FMN transferase [Thalassotalea sp. Y01]
MTTERAKSKHHVDSSSATAETLLPFSLAKTSLGYKVCFSAMASLCEILINSDDDVVVKQLAHAIIDETRRIEQKYSRYRSDSVLTHINQQAGHETVIDDETKRLFAFAKQCYQLSNGLFDISAGILRKAWQFDGSDQLPADKDIEPLLAHIGLDKLQVRADRMWMPASMELDLGGLGKEYAVDRAMLIAESLMSDLNTALPAILINFGGDMLANKAPLNARNERQAWQVGLQHPDKKQNSVHTVSLNTGAIASSGDANRYLLKDGVRYAHILNPKTGKAIVNAPRSVTITAPNCVQAGFIATWSMCQGEHAATFLKELDVGHWLIY